MAGKGGERGDCREEEGKAFKGGDCRGREEGEGERRGLDEREIEKRGEKGNRLKEQKIYGCERRKEGREEMRMQRTVGFWE